MKKLLLAFLFMSLTGISLRAQKTINDPNAEKRDVRGFHGIEVGTGIDLILTEGSSEQVAVSAAKTEYRDKIITKVENGILKIHYENKVAGFNTKKESKDLKAYVSYTSLDKLYATTGSSVKIEGVLKAGSLDMLVNTGAQLEGEVSLTALQLTQSTGSKVSLTGKADKLDVDGSTGSKFKGEEMATTTCNVTVSTGAMVSVKAEKELVVKASTGGNVKYKGNASVREIRSNTGGSVTKI
ncbi:MAG: head GIN domain-containing protein [Chitinophagaceae bacterium]